MKTLFAVLSFLCLLFVAQADAQVVVYYQPTPYPLYKLSGTNMPQDLEKIHIWDGWLPSYYYNKTFQRDGKLQIGGWGDLYETYLKFDLNGLPINPTQTSLWLMPYPRGDSSATTPLAICKVGSSWNLSTTWGSQPSLTACNGWYSAPVPNKWWGVDLTSWYNDWKNAPATNNGVMLFPLYNNNNFDVFRSSRYADFVSDSLADGKRPMLRFIFTPTLQLKMPLPSGYSWLLTTETGGYDCLAKYPTLWPDVAHTDGNYVNGINGSYFSLDFTYQVKGGGLSGYGASVPILAAGRGRVVEVESAVSPSGGKGNYVVIAHVDSNNNPTGFTTRYLHMRYPLLVSVSNTIIPQGKVLGYMGATGVGTGVNLHFGVVYNNESRSTTPQLTKVIMEGKLLKSYQTECLVNSSGIPTTWNRYYGSSNIPVY